ncbi:MAG: N-acetyltransferase [Planctomycetota bacterium]
MIDRILEHKQELVRAARPLRLPIFDRGGDQVGALRLLDAALVAEPAVVAALTEWRGRYMRFFLTHFTPSERRTREWLLNVVLPADDRLLFLIETEPDCFVGNFGLAAIAPGSAELDNLLRGRRGGGPDFIHLAECAMLRALFADASRATATLRVFSTNATTIRLHTGVGFEKTASDPLFIHPDGPDRGLVLTGGLEPAGFTYDEMTITRARFLSTNPWVADAFGAPRDHLPWMAHTT